MKNFSMTRDQRSNVEMRYLVRGALALCASAAVATPAFAQDDISFTGFHVELVTGYDDDGIDYDSDVFGGGKSSQSGWLYGAAVGYDYQTGLFVLGVDAELSETTAHNDLALSGLRVNPLATMPVVTDFDADGGGDIYVGARVGYVVAPQILLYVKGGYTHHKISFDGDGLDNGVPFDFDEKVGMDGFRLGIGGEYAITQNWYGKLEYRYSNYNNGQLDVRGADIDLDPLFEGIDGVRHQVALAFGFRF
jgi:outer membrane immunogenic protein